MYEDLFGKTVLITGGTGGLGRQLIRDFSQSGANLVVQSRVLTDDFNQWLEDTTSEAGVKLTKLLFDLSDEESIKNAFKTMSASTEIDVLVNNAGVAHGGLTQMTPVSEVRKVFEINYFSQILITQSVVRRMIRKGSGKIVNIASISGLDSKTGNVAYGASKAAMIAFTRTLSSELSGSGIRVNCVAPGLMETAMATLMEEKAKQTMIEESGLGRLAKTEEVSRVVVFLSSDQSSLINGQTLRVDGGPS
jgi:3-oxoacyl-[acyl-carrier protein] reductase